MRQLIAFCEGPTEQEFCARVLQPHLFPAGDGIIQPLPIGAKGPRHVFGLGRRSYGSMRRFIMDTIKHRDRREVTFTTLLDVYALPGDFPGKAALPRRRSGTKPDVRALETAFGGDVAHPRFVPNLMLHEFETLLFADPRAFSVAFPDCEAAIGQLEAIAASFPNVEHIDDGPSTAPSKRIIALLPRYEGRKASAGPAIAERIGLRTIRAKCPHFDAWLTRLETLLGTGSAR